MRRVVVLMLLGVVAIGGPSALAYIDGQVNEGAQVFAFHCSTCHGAEGQGLTPEWRATWDQEHQNCWKSTCHGPQHPNTGFQLPREVPALIGQDTLSKYPDGFALHAFIRGRMPYQEPGMLDEDEYWAVTAFLLYANGADLPAAPLDASNAAAAHLKPGNRQQRPLPAVTPAARPVMEASGGSRVTAGSSAAMAAPLAAPTPVSQAPHAQPMRLSSRTIWPVAGIVLAAAVGALVLLTIWAVGRRG